MKSFLSPSSLISWSRLQGAIDESFFLTETRPKSSTSKASPINRSFNRSCMAKTPLSYTNRYSNLFKTPKKSLKTRQIPGSTRKQIRDLYEARCADLSIVSILNQEQRFFELCFRNFIKRKMDLREAGLGIESSKRIKEILNKNNYFACVEVAKNSLKDQGCINIADGILASVTVLHLDVASNGLTCEGIYKLVKKLAQSQSLISLDLRSYDGYKKNRVGTLGAKGIAEMIKDSKFIGYLNLMNTSLTTKGLKMIIESLSQNLSLSHLNVSYNKFSNKVVHNLAYAIVASNLSELFIAGNKIGNLGCAVLSKMLKGEYEGFALIEKLDISDNNIDSVGLGLMFQALCTNNQLKYLNLRKNNFSQGLSPFFKDFLVENYAVKSLNLSNCRLTCEAFYGLHEVFHRNKGIESLNLANNEISEKGAEVLGNVIKLSKTLKVLDLSGNKIKESGGLALARAIEENNSICQLVLKMNDLQDTNILRFSEVARKKQNLLRVNLDNNPCSGRHLESIQKSLEKNLRLKQKTQDLILKETVEKFSKLNATLEELQERIKEKSQEREIFQSFLKEDREMYEEAKLKLRQEGVENMEEYEKLRSRRIQLNLDLKDFTEEYHKIEMCNYTAHDEISKKLIKLRSDLDEMQIKRAFLKESTTKYKKDSLDLIKYLKNTLEESTSSNKVKERTLNYLKKQLQERKNLVETEKIVLMTKLPKAKPMLSKPKSLPHNYHAIFPSSPSKRSRNQL